MRIVNLLLHCTQSVNFLTLFFLHIKFSSGWRGCTVYIYILKEKCASWQTNFQFETNPQHTLPSSVSHVHYTPISPKFTPLSFEINILQIEVNRFLISINYYYHHHAVFIYLYKLGIRQYLENGKNRFVCDCECD